MRIGVQREARVSVPEDAGQRLRVHPARQSVGGEGVAQIVEADEWQIGLLQKHLQLAICRMRIYRFLRFDRIMKYPLTDRRLFSFPQKIRRTRRQNNRARTGIGFCFACGKTTAILHVNRAADSEPAATLIEVHPLETAYFAAAEPRRQLGVKSHATIYPGV